MNINKIHPSYYMVDELNSLGKKEDKTDFLSREGRYELAFCEAFKLLDDKRSYKTSKELFEFFEKIHNAACSHIDSAAKKVSVQMTDHGNNLASVPFNGYGFSKGIIADDEGLEDIIKTIWKENEPFILIAKDDQNKYYLSNQRLYVYKGNGDESTGLSEMMLRPIKECIIFNNEKSTSDITLHGIKQKMKLIFNMGVFHSLSPHRMILACIAREGSRQQKALGALQNYLGRINTLSNDNEKIRLIAKTVNTLFKLHMWYDGNGRTAYLFANFLMEQNGLGYFYPRNMCLFDANSEENMVREITLGQTRFKDKFGTPEKLHEGLKSYSSAMKALIVSVFQTGDHTLKMTLVSRDLNLLFRRAAQNDRFFNLLQFMVDNSDALDIDITSKGNSGNNAADVANQNNNKIAMDYLRTKGLNPSKNDVMSALTQLVLQTKVDSLKQALDNGNLNLLFRKTALNEKYINLLQFMGDNRDNLNIDINSKGENSGNAADVANKNNNTIAKEYLSKLGLNPSTSDPDHKLKS